MTIGLDFETEPFGPGNMAPRPVCLAVADLESTHVFHWKEAHPILVSYLRDDRPIAIANASFDMAVIIAHYPDLLPLVFDAYNRGIIKDVLIRQKLIDIADGTYRHHGPYSLANLVKRWTGKELPKDDAIRMNYAQWRDVPISEWPQEFIDYARDDAWWHVEIYDRQMERAEILDDQDRQTRADFALNLASVWGIRTDPEGVRVLREACEREREALEPALLDAGLVEVTKKGEIKKKMRITQQRMLDDLGWDNVKLTKKGREVKNERGDWQQVKYVAIDAEACADSNDPLLQAYTEYNQLGTLLEGHVKAMEAGTSAPIHTSFEVLLETGRTSSRKPNIQNVRRREGARECFIPREGTAFVGCDYDKAELHTLAQICIEIFDGRSNLAEALNNGYDPHTGLGAKLVGVDYGTALERIQAGDAGMKEWRQRAKPANFGFPGGMSPFGMIRYAKTAYGVIITEREGKELYQGWQEQWPVVQEYLNLIRNKMNPAGWTDLLHQRSNRWRGRIPFCVAANSLFQGRAADGAKAALWGVTEACYKDRKSPLFGSRIVNFLHDELILEVPLDRIHEGAKELSQIMIREFNKFTPDVPVRATPVAMDRWSKKAETLRDGAGRLQVWEYNNENS